MPIYEYGCPECGHVFEKLVKLNAAPPACPECGHDPVEKKVSAAGFILKGSGWYKDHYGLKKNSGSSEGAKKASDTKASGSADAGASASSTPSTPAASE